ncbi:mitochondrial import protein Pam17-domain-containing protein [Lineolata rhizophorae]|uniref:Presequence translocated-associated motor subunit PAM17 n=1 Tax=Lineolata rhizophorae TaxID=578093 RepID=A0A6A6NY56_9PEZI|nr:mitochondrial import protein Pam17-domain-containing protein [Lineolata rhizophorae]
MPAAAAATAVALPLRPPAASSLARRWLPAPAAAAAVSPSPKLSPSRPLPPARLHHAFSAAPRSPMAPRPAAAAAAVPRPASCLFAAAAAGAARTPARGASARGPGARAASTTTTTTGGAARSSAASSAAEPALPWNRFLALRRTRRRISLAASVVAAAGGTGLGMTAMLDREWDAAGAQALGLDPFVVLGLGAVAFAAGGWLAGPAFGNALFNLRFRALKAQIADKERAFYARIKKYRADPSASSPQNPVPDYYGEKIGSVMEYRRWLKDQRAFRLKRGQDML